MAKKKEKVKWQWQGVPPVGTEAYKKWARKLLKKHK